MAFGTGKTYSKQLPGAECVFQPPDLADYAEDAWDIRISIGDAPLEEAFYFTVEDPKAASLPIKRLLEEYALNPELASELDVAEYPDLPFIQQELLQYYTSAGKGGLKLDIYANNSDQGPLRLYEQASKHLSVCTYLDGSWDYRVLDLVFDPTVPEPGGYKDEQSQRRYRKQFLLLALGQARSAGDESLRALCEHEAISAALGARGYRDQPELYRAVEDLRGASLIKRVELAGGRPGYGLALTPKGEEAIGNLEAEAERLVETYDRYASAAVSPPALGVPGGFDVRVQMMEYDGLDIEEASILWVLHEARDELVGADNWLENLQAATRHRIPASTTPSGRVKHAQASGTPASHMVRGGAKRTINIDGTIMNTKSVSVHEPIES